MAEAAAPKLAEEELLRMTADLVAAYVSNNPLPTTQLGEIIKFLAVAQRLCACAALHFFSLGYDSPVQPLLS